MSCLASGGILLGHLKSSAEARIGAADIRAKVKAVVVILIIIAFLPCTLPGRVSFAA
jgi:hypothetical protein